MNTIIPPALAWSSHLPWEKPVFFRWDIASLRMFKVFKIYELWSSAQLRGHDAISIGPLVISRFLMKQLGVCRSWSSGVVGWTNLYQFAHEVNRLCCFSCEFCRVFSDFFSRLAAGEVSSCRLQAIACTYAVRSSLPNFEILLCGVWVLGQMTNRISFDYLHRDFDRSTHNDHDEARPVGPRALQ